MKTFAEVEPGIGFSWIPYGSNLNNPNVRLHLLSEDIFNDHF